MKLELKMIYRSSKTKIKGLQNINLDKTCKLKIVFSKVAEIGIQTIKSMNKAMISMDSKIEIPNIAHFPTQNPHILTDRPKKLQYPTKHQ